MKKNIIFLLISFLLILPTCINEPLNPLSENVKSGTENTENQNDETSSTSNETNSTGDDIPPLPIQPPSLPPCAPRPICDGGEMEITILEFTGYSNAVTGYQLGRARIDNIIWYTHDPRGTNYNALSVNDEIDVHFMWGTNPRVLSCTLPGVNVNDKIFVRIWGPTCQNADCSVGYWSLGCYTNL